MCSCVFVRVYLCVGSVNTTTQVCMNVSYACIYIYQCVLCIYVCRYVCIHVYACMCVCIFVCMYVCLHVCMYVWHVCKYVYVYIWLGSSISPFKPFKKVVRALLPFCFLKKEEVNQFRLLFFLSVGLSVCLPCSLYCCVYLSFSVSLVSACAPIGLSAL